MKKMQMAVLTVGVVFLMGCGNKPAETKLENETGAKKEVIKDKTGEQKEKNKEEQGDGVGKTINTIKDAMLSGKPTKCVYTIKNEEDGGEMKSTTYFEGKKFKTEILLASQKQYMIFDKEGTMYSWTDGQKQGMKMTDKCVEELNKQIPEIPGSEGVPANDNKDETFNPEENFDGAMNVKCEATSGIDFSLPAGVTFIDQCEMMKNIPGGMKIPGVNP